MRHTSAVRAVATVVRHTSAVRAVVTVVRHTSAVGAVKTDAAGWRTSVFFGWSRDDGYRSQSGNKDGEEGREKHADCCGLWVAVCVGVVEVVFVEDIWDC